MYLGKFEKDRPIVLAGIAYVLVATILGGDINPWYYFPLVIFFAAGYALLIHKIFTQPEILNMSLFFSFHFYQLFIGAGLFFILI